MAKLDVDSNNDVQLADINRYNELFYKIGKSTAEKNELAALEATYANYKLKASEYEAVLLTTNTNAQDITDTQTDIGAITPSSGSSTSVVITTATSIKQLTLDISTTITGGNITINRNGAGAKDLLNVDGTNVTELSQDTRFFRVVEETLNFTLLPSGGLKEFFGDGSDGTIPDLNVVTTAPNGGTVANLWDMNAGTVFTTGTLSSASDQVVLNFDFGYPAIFGHSTMSMYFRLWQVAISTGANRNIILQKSNDGLSWTTSGTVSLSTTPADINLIGEPTAYRYWRVVLVAGGSNCTLSAQGATYNYISGDTQTTKIVRLVEPSTLNGGAVIKQYTQYTLPVGYEHTVQNPCQGLVIYSQGDAVVDGVIDMSQKAGLAPNGNIVPMIMTNFKVTDPEGIQQYNELTTVLSVLYGGAGGNGGNGGNGGATTSGSGGTGGAGRQNIGGLGGGGGGGGAVTAVGRNGGSIGYAELGNGAISSFSIKNANAYTSYLPHSSHGAGGYPGIYNTLEVYNLTSLEGSGMGGCGGVSAINSPAAMNAPAIGGYSGGFLMLLAKGNTIISGSLKSDGGNGGNGSNGVSSTSGTAGGGGGGGGAGGGVISILHKGSYTNTGTIQVNGGSGGSGGSAGTGGGSAGTAGTSGSVGTINIQQL